MTKNEKTEKIKACIAIAIILLSILITVIFSIKYQVEGETNMPFNLSKITIVSTAEGVENEGTQERWNLNIFQNNDIYFSIEKNEKYNKQSQIENIAIENIKIVKQPELGQIEIYMPNSSDGRLFTYNDENILKENKLIYNGGLKTDSKLLQIGNQGGTLVIRFSNSKIGTYISNEDQEIKHDGTMLAKTEATMQNMTFEVNFDVIINVKNNSYKTNITIELPTGNNLIEEGTSSKEITEKFVFKRVS